MKILLLEDDYTYKESIKELLEEMGYSVDDFDDGEKALDALFETSYQLALLDIRVPNLDGYEILKQIRKAKLDLPIIFITSLTDINNLSLGYELGCNDYLKKPFELKELELRVKELIKNHYQTSKGGEFALSCGYMFNFETGELRRDEEQVMLTQKEQELIRFLIRRKNTFCDIELIRENVWEGKEISYADIRMYIRKIRLKVNEEEFIKSSRGLGYKIDVVS